MVKRFVFIALTAILFAGCNSNELDFDNIELRPVTGVFSLPIGSATYTIRELILDQEDSTLGFQVDDDSLITLVYFDSTSYQSDTDFVQIDDIANSGNVDLSAIPITAGPATIPLTETFTFNFSPNDPADVLDSLFYASGDVSINVTSTATGTLDWSFSLTNFVSVTNELPLVVSAANPVRSLLNHKALLSGTNNMFSTDFTGTITLTGGETYTGGSITFDITFANQTFSIIHGKFGQDTVSVGNETVDIEFFKKMGEDGIFFGNPTIKFFFENSFGIPIGLDLSGLYGSDGMGGTRTFLEGDIVDNIPVIAISDVANAGALVQDTIELNKSNSSIVDLLSTSPGRLGFDLAGISNPYDVNASNFVTPGPEMNSVIQIEIPLEVKLVNLEQKLHVSLGDGFELSEDVDSAAMRVATVNEMPFSGILAIDIQDADSNSLYLVTDNLVLEAPFINVNGIVTDPNGRIADIKFGRAGIEALEVGTHIEMTVTLNTPGSLNSRDIFVKILADYQLEVSLGVTGTLNVDL